MTKQHTTNEAASPIARRLARLTAPFLALGVTFIALGVILEDDSQFTFGIVWLVIAAIAMFVRARRRHQIRPREPEHRPRDV